MKQAVLILFFLCSLQYFSQQTLRISVNRFGNTKIFDVFEKELFEYKLKGDFRYRKGIIVAMTDSLLVFENEKTIKLTQIKAIRLRNNIHLVHTLQGAFIIAGVGFISLNTFNNLILENSPIINEKAVYISAALLGTAFLINQIGIKRIRINKNKDLKILDLNFQELNKSD